jgi:hypothetical protein
MIDFYEVCHADFFYKTISSEDLARKGEINAAEFPFT